MSLTSLSVWYHATSCCNNSVIEFLLVALKKKGYDCGKWSKRMPFKPGLLFLGGYNDYEELISFLQLQVKGMGSRVCVINTSTNCLEGEYKLKILKYGAEVFLENCFLKDTPDALFERLARWFTVERLLNAPAVKKRVIGSCIATVQMLRNIIEVAFYSRNNVLLLGERGVGKEQTAAIIHELDTRKDKGDFVILDCTTLKKELSGSELFGHEKGAFTGAEHSREGAVALAHKGTFFMDEIAEMPAVLQAEFLRVIQEGVYKKVGGNVWRHSDFRLVSATNRPIDVMMHDAGFRDDLFDRIATTVIKIPSLNERNEDIPELIDYFLCSFFDGDKPEVEKEVYEFLSARKYAGNIRELKNILSNVFLKYPGKGPVTLGDLPVDKISFDIPAQQVKWYEKKELLEALDEAFETGYDLKQIKDVIQSLSTQITLQKVGRNKDASRILGKSERWLQMQKIKQRS